MGDFNIKPIETDQQRAAFYHAILRDLEAFEFMLNEGIVEQKSDMIGAEQEICIVDKHGNPAAKALDILADVESDLFTNELALYNLEVNLSPQKLEGDCFSKVAHELRTAMKHGQEVAAKHDTTLLLTGNLPTLKFRHLLFDYMTPEDRYKVLSHELLDLRGRNFEIFLQGVDDFHTSLDSVLFEACNTSFQLHLQVDPREFVEMHNWAQMISGPVLSACCNSPLLFGKELWAENRIALFKQSLDTRAKLNHSRIKLPRVYFGNDWLRTSALDLWKKDVTRFPVLLRGYGEEDPMEALKRGITPKLKSIRLHNGTTYTWNRLCYGVANNSPHIRIECRYLPSGPTEEDEMANFAFWIGLMKAMPEDKKGFWKDIDFRVAKSNFLRGARHGLKTGHEWFGKTYGATELILEHLLPMAQQGLESVEVDEKDISYYLNVIEERVSSGQTGAAWMIENYRELQKHVKPSVALRCLVKHDLKHQNDDIPVHKWGPVLNENSDCGALQQSAAWVEDIMNQEVFSVKENVSLEIAKTIMDWKNIHHLPIENQQGDLIGILAYSMINGKSHNGDTLVRDLMETKVVSIGPGDQITKAKELMDLHQISCLPVVENDKVLGILTSSDFK